MMTAAGLVQAKCPLRGTAMTSSHSCSLMLKIMRARGGAVVVAVGGGAGAGVVDDDLRALFGHLDGDGAADATAGAGDDGDFTFEQWHVYLRCRVGPPPHPGFLFHPARPGIPLRPRPHPTGRPPPGAP